MANEPVEHTPTIDVPSARSESPAPLRRDAEENRQRILRAASELFEAEGVEAVSMHRIARAAGVGQGTLYRHYIHKGDLCGDIIAESMERARRDFDVFWEETKAWRALDRLDTMIARFVSLLDAKLPYMAAIGEACAGEYRLQRFDLPEYRWLHGILCGLLDDAQAEGSIPAADSCFTAHALMAALRPDLYEFQRDQQGLSQEQIVRGVRRLYT